MKDKNVVIFFVIVAVGYFIIAVGTTGVRIISSDTGFLFNIIASLLLGAGVIISIVGSLLYLANNMKGEITKIKFICFPTMLIFGAMIVVIKVLLIENIDQWAYDLVTPVINFFINIWAVLV